MTSTEPPAKTKTPPKPPQSQHPPPSATQPPAAAKRAKGDGEVAIDTQQSPSGPAKSGNLLSDFAAHRRSNSVEEIEMELEKEQKDPPTSPQNTERPLKQMPTRGPMLVDQETFVTQPFPKDSLEGYTKSPFLTEENPHLQVSLPVKALPPKTSITFTNATFESLVLPKELAEEGVAQAFIDEYTSNTSTTMLVLPFYAGNHTFSKNGGAILRNIENFFKEGWPDERTEDVIVYAPTPSSTNANKDLKRYDRPWTLVITGLGDPQIRNFLRARRVIAHSPEVTFHILSANDMCQSWVLASYKVTNGRNAEAEKKKALTAIQKKMWEDAEYFRLIAKAAVKEEAKMTTPEYLEHLMKSWTITYAESPDRGKSAHNYVLMGKPATKDADIQDAIIDRMEKISIQAGYQLLEPMHKKVRCVACKSELHYAEFCPFPKTSGWLGPASYNPNAGKPVSTGKPTSERRVSSNNEKRGGHSARKVSDRGRR